MENRNIIVTGGAGYIGSHACKILKQQGYNPIVVDNLKNGHKYAVKWGPLHEICLTDKTELLKIFKKYKPIAVLHFASLILVGESVTNPYEYYENNITGSLTLLQVMKEVECSNIIFSSTCAVFGDAKELVIHELHPKNPVNPYGESKLMVEKILQSAANAYNLKYSILRYFNATGADPECEIGENHIPETHIIPLLLQTASGVKGEFSIYGDDYDTPDGTCIRDYIHVYDIANVHVLSLEYMLKNNKSLDLNLGTGKGYSVREVIKIASEVTNRNIPTCVLSRRAGDSAVLVADPSKLFRELNWKPTYLSLRTQIEHAWNWYLKLNKTSF